ncbi:uncharacterized protein LOC124537501 [Vanessa cardui]|uniref:uncharacterized protein LOC124537501 n=1 Tax=Vanessa cardui TaxID=171605 RepID=UPI001F14234B|nr:uncharacterized protein LOC124537501 [Vanessa cardui]
MDKLSTKKPIITLFKNYMYKSTKSIPMKNAFIDEVDKYFEPKSLGRLKSLITDFKERNLSLDILKDSKLFLNKEEKSRFNKFAKKYENKSALLKSYENLRQKVTLTPSKSIIFRNMINDYKKGNFSFTQLSDKQIMDINKMNSQDLNKLLDQFESKKNKNNIFKNIDSKKINSKFKNYSLTNLDFLKNINSDELKKQFSLTASKHKMLGNMIEDYKKGKISLTALQNDLKNDKKILNKENLNQMLKYYKEQKSKHQPIVKQSKFKQLKSDLRAKIDFL